MQQRPIATTIFGILSIGFGLFGVANVLISIFILPGLKTAYPVLKQMEDNPVYAGWNKISLPLNGLACVFLVAAGIGLLLLRNWGRLASIIYGIYAIVMGVIGTIVALIASASAVMVIGAVVGGIFGLIYPVLLIIFMKRPNVVSACNPAPPMP